ncbi:MAG TPA: nucleotide exchange factor GrpE [Tangfeifania sp.]|nr:nucleotide exchange factor GrpE [Tangfeifania sp.]
MAKEKMNKASGKKQEEEVKDRISSEKVNGENNSTENKDEESVEEPDENEEKNTKKDTNEDHIKQLEEKFEELSDKHLRLQAEFDNFRRRTLKEKADLIKSGGETVLTGVLSIVDDFERAIESMKEISDDDTGKQGTLLIYTKFKDFLKQNNVKEIEALHQDFDVDLHEAITKIPAPEKKLKGKVVDVVQKGYTLNDKVIRFAKVVVGE